MNFLMSLRNCSFAAVALSATMAIGNDGDTIPDPDHPDYQLNLNLYQAIEAACGVGRTKNIDGDGPLFNNTVGSGILIAPNMVLTASHVITGDRFFDRLTQPEFNVFDDPAAMLDENGDPTYTVRFRLNPNGDVGDLAGGGGSFYQAPVKRILFPLAFTSSIGTKFEEFDIAILILADGPNDTGIWSNGWIDHITPMAIPPIRLDSRMEFIGGAASYGPVPDHTREFCCYRGILRYRPFDTFPSQLINAKPTGISTSSGSLFDRTQRYFKLLKTDDPTWTIGNTPPGGSDPASPDGAFGFGDSGGVFVITAENGDILPVWGVWHGGGPTFISDYYNSLSWDYHFGDSNAPYGTPWLHASSEYDLVEHAAPNNGVFDSPDWVITAADAIAMAASNPALLGSDWNNDGQVNGNDFRAYSREIETALNPYFSSPLFPLPIGGEDVDGNGRFNSQDSDALSAMIGLSTPEAIIHDYDGSGVIDLADIAIIDTVLTTRRAPQGVGGLGELLFDHGILGDLDRDGDIDSADITLAMAFDFSNGFEGTAADDPLYDVIFDANLDQIIDLYDKQVIASAMMPVSIGDISGPVHVLSSVNPDWQRPVLNARRTLSAYASFMSNPSSITIPPGFDLVSDGWAGGSTHFLPDSAQVATEDQDYTSVHNGIVNMTDIRYLLTSWRDMDVGDSFSTTSLLDFWFLDVNADGRANIKDLRFLDTVLDGQTSGIADWDYDRNGVYDEHDTAGWFDLYHIGSIFGQGILGDFNGSASPLCVCTITPEFQLESLDFCEDIPLLDCPTQLPVPDVVADCDDLSEMRAIGLDILFESGYKYGDSNFVIQLDADLDGDNDFFDLREVLYLLQPGDITFDGWVASDDLVEFNTRFPAADGSTTNDPNYEIDLDINRDGIINSTDLSDLIGRIASPICS